ncbi:MAG TPA: response regulator [Polyangia bacterium]|nr:response regulator [Polyangia bacterium]
MDDDPDACEAISGLLDQSGYAVEAAPDPAHALARLAEVHPDLVVSDLQMPGMSGLELIRRIQARQPGTPVILVTGAETQDLCTGAKKYGAADCLTKPVSPEELVWAIERALVCRRAPLRASRRASAA